MKANEFDDWLDKYIEEKGINLDEPFSLEEIKLLKQSSIMLM